MQLPNCFSVHKGVFLLLCAQYFQPTMYEMGNGATDSASDCCIIRGTVAGFESLTIIRSPNCIVDPGYIIDT